MGDCYDILVCAHVRASEEAGEFSLLCGEEGPAVRAVEGPRRSKLERSLAAVACSCGTGYFTGMGHIRFGGFRLWGDGANSRPSVVCAVLPVCGALLWVGLASLGSSSFLALGLTLGGGGGHLHEEGHQFRFGQSHQASLCALGLGCACCRRLGLALGLDLRREFCFELRFVGGFALCLGELAPCVRAVGGSVGGCCHGYGGLSDFDVEAATKVMNNSWKNQNILPA